MNIRNCRKCGKMFNYAFGPIICQSCVNAAEEVFQRAKKYVQDNPGCDIQELADQVEVEPSQIKQWIREERLQFSDDSPIRINCDGCGAMIRSGKYCDACKTNMTRNLKSAYQTNTPQVKIEKKTNSGSNRMRFLDN